MHTHPRTQSPTYNCYALFFINFYPLPYCSLDKVIYPVSTATCWVYLLSLTSYHLVSTGKH